MDNSLTRHFPALGERLRTLMRRSAPAIVRLALHVAKLLGLFRIARHATGHGLRILCYHGFALAEEYQYRSKLFIQKDLFRRRLEFLRRRGYPILPLREALPALREGRLPPGAVVITIDDGWRGVISQAFPIIQEMRVPVTLYVTTYYIEHRMPVYSVTLSYLLWRTRRAVVEMPRGLGTFALDREGAKANELAQRYGVALSPQDRLAFLKEVAAAVDVPFSEIEQQGLFELLTPSEIRTLAEAGVDIQLHTHRHQWSLDDSAKVEQEIVENRNFLAPLVSGPLEHFCYPSGLYDAHQEGLLSRLGIKSATTLDPGLNYPGVSRFALRRIVDGGPVSDIEFEAEIAGFMEMIRSVRRLLAPLLRRPPRPALSRRLASRDEATASRAGESSEGRQLDSRFYDDLHAQYNGDDIRALYSPLFRRIVEIVRQRHCRSVLEVGCGNGFLAQMLLRQPQGSYRGFDFSRTGVRNAGVRTGRPELFFCADALDPRTYDVDYDTIVCTEVLEHIDADLDVIRNWREGAWCICTVPNFDYESHVRYFRSCEAVRARYGGLIDIEDVVRVSRPVMPGGDVRAYLRTLRWSRNDPRKLLGYLGVQTFARLGGWFLFYGTRTGRDAAPLGRASAAGAAPVADASLA